MTKLLLVVILVLASGCASVTPQGTKVRVTNNPQATVGCKFLGSVTAPVMVSESDGEVGLQNRAAELGGNVVFRAPHRIGPKLEGEVYFCKETP
jgi:hypothetical protein